jgi:peptidoglycan L-alanyl-D-glutamate endopeptidase CwlK
MFPWVINMGQFVNNLLTKKTSTTITTTTKATTKKPTTTTTKKPETKVMRDKVSIQRVALLHPKIREEVAQIVIKAEEKLPPKYAVRIVQGLRTFAEQDALYAQGRTKPGSIVTNAKGGQSIHNYGLAVDFAILVDKDGNGTYDEMSWDIKKDNDKDGIADWLEVVHVFESAGYEWGGKWSSFKDYPHLQKPYGLTWKQMLERYNNKDFIPNTKYIRI